MTTVPYALPAPHTSAGPEPDMNPLTIAAHFAIGRPRAAQPLGGTATPKWRVETDGGVFVLRRRPDESASPEQAEFEHAAVTRLAEAGLPVPRPRGCCVLPGGMYEMYSWLDAGETRKPSPCAVGRFLAVMHGAFASGVPAGKQGVQREDHPDRLQPHLDRLPTSPGRRRELVRQLELVRVHLGDRQWHALPQAVIHGDLHPGNLRVQGDRVVGLFDFDYLSVQARLRDVADVMIFFAANRARTFNPDDIRSLVQPFILDPSRCAELLRAHPLTDDERRLLPLAIRSRWLQMKLRATRKVSSHEMEALVFDGFFDVLKQLDVPPGTGWRRG